MVMKTLVLRVDYGGGAAYPDQHAAVAALYRFVLAAALPKPIVVDTGDGLEVYWPLGEELPVGRWRRSARARGRLPPPRARSLSSRHDRCPLPLAYPRHAQQGPLATILRDGARLGRWPRSADEPRSRSHPPSMAVRP
jgi:hypothetical protein